MRCQGGKSRTRLWRCRWWRAGLRCHRRNCEGSLIETQTSPPTPSRLRNPNRSTSCSSANNKKHEFLIDSFFWSASNWTIKSIKWNKTRRSLTSFESIQYPVRFTNKNKNVKKVEASKAWFRVGLCVISSISPPSPSAGYWQKIVFPKQLHTEKFDFHTIPQWLLMVGFILRCHRLVHVIVRSESYHYED